MINIGTDSLRMICLLYLPKVFKVERVVTLSDDISMVVVNRKKSSYTVFPLLRREGQDGGSGDGGLLVDVDNFYPSPLSNFYACVV